MSSRREARRLGRATGGPATAPAGWRRSCPCSATAASTTASAAPVSASVTKAVNEYSSRMPPVPMPVKMMPTISMVHTTPVAGPRSRSLVRSAIRAR